MYIHTYLPTYLPTYIHTYIYTYIYIHTHMCISIKHIIKCIYIYIYMDTMISPDSSLFAPFKIVPPSFPSVSKVTMGSLGAFSSRSSVDRSPLWQAKTSCRSNGSSLGQYDRKTSTTPGTMTVWLVVSRDFLLKIMV